MTDIEPVKDFKSHRFCDRVTTTKLTKTGLSVALVLLKHANSKGTCWPGNDRIAESIGHDHTGHVRGALRSLERHGLIERVKHGRIRGLSDQEGGPLQDHSGWSTTGPPEVKTHVKGKKNDEKPSSSSRDQEEQIPPASPVNPNPVPKSDEESGSTPAAAAKRPTPDEIPPDDDDLPEDLRKLHTYVLWVEPKPKKNSRAAFGNHKTSLIENPATARALAHQVGKPVIPVFRESGDFTFLLSFTPAPSLEARQERRVVEVRRLMKVAIGSRDVEEFLGMVEAGETGDLPVPVREQLEPKSRVLAEELRKQRWSEEQVFDLFARLDFPVPEPEPEPEAAHEPAREPEATTPPDTGDSDDANESSDPNAGITGSENLNRRHAAELSDEEKDDFDLPALLADVE